MTRTSSLLIPAVSLISYTALKAQTKVYANDLRVVTTTVPFLNITPDARSGAMGDVGVAISPDVNTIHWNAAKLAFEEKDMAVGLNYTPWLRQIVPDISLSYLTGYKRIDPLSAVGASLRYFSLGDIQFTNDQGQNLKTYRPYEFSFDIAYARKLSENFSVGVAGRYIYSNLAGNLNMNNGSSTRPGQTFAGDVSAYYTKPLRLKSKKEVTMSYGLNISNMGGKITYTTAADRDFIPINLKLGTAWKYKVDEYNEVTFAFDLNKLLVPTTPVYNLDSAGNPIILPNGKPSIAAGKDPKNIGVVPGMLQSFADAPGGFSEEMHEINPSIGVEYWYAKQVAGRIGYFYEHPTKGNRQWLSMGLGLRYNVLGIDIAYLVPTNGAKSTIRSPLENTLRFSLTFNLEGKSTRKKG